LALFFETMQNNYFITTSGQICNPIQNISTSSRSSKTPFPTSLSGLLSLGLSPFCTLRSSNPSVCLTSSGQDDRTSRELPRQSMSAGCFGFGPVTSQVYNILYSCKVPNPRSYLVQSLGCSYGHVLGDDHKDAIAGVRGFSWTDRIGIFTAESHFRYFLSPPSSKLTCIQPLRSRAVCEPPNPPDFPPVPPFGYPSLQIASRSANIMHPSE
jgi:hypothetical protein